MWGIFIFILANQKTRYPDLEKTSIVQFSILFSANHKRKLILEIEAFWDI